jgi:hypothetical protein
MIDEDIDESEWITVPAATAIPGRRNHYQQYRSDKVDNECEKRPQA